MNSERLDEILSMVEKVDKIADIGTDHGKMAYEIIRLNLANVVIATELREKSIQKLKKSLIRSKKTNIIPRVGDGLKPLEKDEVDEVIIAGMGGNLISDILKTSHDEKFIEKNPILILQPVQFQNIMRKYLHENMFKIIDESIAFENNKFYHIIKSIKKDQKDNIYDEYQGLNLDFCYNIGSINIQKKEPVYLKYIESEIEKNQKIRAELYHNNINKKLEKVDRYIEFLRRKS